MKKMLIFFILVVIGFTACALDRFDEPVYSSSTGKAVGGWDTVSYFNSSSPQLGSEQWQTEYNGATWLFSSEENLNLFKASPSKYAPAYGGYCAWAASQNYLAPGSPRYWDIFGGRLYLNFNAGARRNFLKDPLNLIKDADKNWPGLSARLK